jgi:hypothetical protein
MRGNRGGLPAGALGGADAVLDLVLQGWSFL